jgi:hypothetical protein
VSSQPARTLADELATAAEQAARLRALLAAFRAELEAAGIEIAPHEPGRLAGRRLAALKAREKRAEP